MKPIEGCILFYLIMFCQLETQAQNHIEIEDPGLVFSYELPEKWVNKDDPYYHYIIPPCAKKGIELTYYDGRCKVIEDCFEAETKGAFPQQYQGFKIIESGTFLIDDIKAPWIIFSFLDEETQAKETGFYCSFIELKQQFTFRFIDSKNCFDSERSHIFSVIDTFEVRAN